MSFVEVITSIQRRRRWPLGEKGAIMGEAEQPNNKSMKNVVKICNENGDEAAAIYSIKHVGDRLVMDGKALGTMQMDMILSAEDALRAVKMAFSWEVLSFIILLPFYTLRNKLRKEKGTH